ncbi:hypothetical protein JWG42_15850 [Desulfoprunum benzoelyticum]|uniref:Uncharacterized protein n=1 Tax=Desulfoprunum benzoelyticum TaxID=1506996 RepID=A0A840UZM4_9BACT|nr:hypothetical protein [Desulfoprunum benzoelyticum]MBB5347000.1 hypothetical protein [Desulfoprunum benzoelyticum]MBM9531632.1 hypothetical protein [Desulfoprunum benzoelyticum]
MGTTGIIQFQLGKFRKNDLHFSGLKISSFGIVAPKMDLSPFPGRFEYFLSFEGVAEFYLVRYEKLLQH